MQGRISLAVGRYLTRRRLSSGSPSKRLKGLKAASKYGPEFLDAILKKMRDAEPEVVREAGKQINILYDLLQRDHKKKLVSFLSSGNYQTRETAMEVLGKHLDDGETFEELCFALYSTEIYGKNYIIRLLVQSKNKAALPYFFSLLDYNKFVPSRTLAEGIVAYKEHITEQDVKRILHKLDLLITEKSRKGTRNGSDRAFSVLYTIELLGHDFFKRFGVDKEVIDRLKKLASFDNDLVVSTANRILSSF